jgi:flagellar hook-basal body complex protein FliE
MNPLAAISTQSLQDLTAKLPAQLQDLKPKTIPLNEAQAAAPSSALSGATNTQFVGTFQNVLGNLVGEVSQKQAAADNDVNGLLSGKNVSLHQAMISMEEASVSFQMMVEVRNKLLDSYQELMRMQM